MKCEICGIGSMQGVTLYRRNPKGETGIWRCAEHHTPETFVLAADPVSNAIEAALHPKAEIIQ